MLGTLNSPRSLNMPPSFSRSPDMVDRFEESAALVTAELARFVPKDVQSLVFASPVSTRSTDLSLVWHPVYRHKHRLVIGMKAMTDLLADALKGCLRIWPSFRQFGHAVYGIPIDRVLVVPVGCGREIEEGRFDTPFVETERDDCVFVFGPLSRLAGHAVAYQWQLGYDIIRPLIAFMKAAVQAGFHTNVPRHHKVFLIVQWMSWVLSLRWLHLYCLQRTLTEFVVANRIRKIGSIHEMHPHARVVWKVAAGYAATGYTVQHAGFTEGKRWLFPLEAEREAGLGLPDTFFVFHEQVGVLLQRHYPKTQFRLGCSRRYAQWRDQKDLNLDLPGYVLFVGALPQFDNHIIIMALKRLLEEGVSLQPPRVRLHPSARIDPKLRWWLHRREKQGQVAISREATLIEDLAGASVVVGMGSTALQEALVSGRPVVQLTHPEFLEYLDLRGIEGALQVDRHAFFPGVLTTYRGTKVDRVGARKRLGLSQPIVTYCQLFAAA